MEKLQVHLASSPQLEDIHRAWISARRWEKAKSASDSALATLVLNGLKHTAVTAVLIGPETAHREWMQHEIHSTLKRGNGPLGIFIHNILDQDGRTAPQSPKPVAARLPPQ
ncbi:TIR domain-containing protein [Nesterenkonia aurantiaca]|uniref:TIR domain-containing protein n=1 Tax=Nesterenkonia aurantiaca TaxID=1436010 RepID=UPI003EE5844B